MINWNTTREEVETIGKICKRAEIGQIKQGRTAENGIQVRGCDPMTDKSTDDRCITIRFPKTLWIKLRRLQENGVIKSIQNITTKVLAEWVKGK